MPADRPPSAEALTRSAAILFGRLHELERYDPILGHNLQVAACLYAAWMAAIRHCDGLTSWRPGCGKPMPPLVWDDEGEP